MGSGEQPILSVEKLEVVYHKVSVAVQGVSFEVGRNRIVALLGTNGAGKTTTLRAISGFLGVDDASVTEGSVRFEGEEIRNRRPHFITRKGIVLVPEREKIFENLTVEENLQVSSALKKGHTGKRDAYELTYRHFPVLGNLRRRLGGYLSGGERQMLSLATALVCDPKLLLVDELSLGLAPIVADQLMKLLKLIRDEQKVTILLVEQNALAALEVADFGYVLENGHIVFSGDPGKLMSHQDVREFYLGTGDRDSGRRSYRDVKQYRRTRRWYG
jgi:branched-chain amino acid transport system ATP-binding protein